MTWLKTYPLSSSVVSASVTQITDNWDIIEDWWGVAHSTLTTATSGDHKIGRTGVILVDGTSGVSAISSPGTGALAYDTTKGELEIYRTAGWERLTANKWSRVRYVWDYQTIPASTPTKLTSAATTSGTYDTLSEFASNRITVLGAGYYLIAISVRFPATSSNYRKEVGIYKNGVAITVAGAYGPAIRTVAIKDIVLLAATNYIELWCWHNHTESVQILGGSIHMTRLSR